VLPGLDRVSSFFFGGAKRVDKAERGLRGAIRIQRRVRLIDEVEHPIGKARAEPIITEESVMP
jgi:hypothetical protein